jgi:putative selenate reductase
MSDHFSPVSLRHLAILILRQRESGTYFGIPEELFFTGKSTLPSVQRFGCSLDTPLGVAAGPHTQLAQNIVGAWLCGARYIELKTIQKLDELQVTKPCIAMQDEGYNCEWSQELTLNQSYDQYLNAWILIHLLHHHYQGSDSVFGTLFNMSAGYDLAGIQGEKVSWFLDKMRDCSLEKQAKLAEIADLFPGIRDINIPDCISDNITLSTMHGCPAGEIEEIAAYLLKERHLHTVVKLNPTLLGTELLRTILNQELGFQTIIPDEAFAHDLKYTDALSLIHRLDQIARQEGLSFGVKLTNTLESLNTSTGLPEHEKMVYMSGRALHPVSVNLAFILQKEFQGKLDISFSAGADCFNLGDLLSCGLTPVTVCSDLLKPGGYGKLKQYLQEAEAGLQKAMQGSGNSLDKLEYYAQAVRKDPRYQKGWSTPGIKTPLKLGFFDCIHAPCTCTCPSSQDIPAYLRYTAEGNTDKAFEVILRTNPFPAVTGLVCDHLCQTKCNRVHYDEAIRIRDIKHFVTDQHPDIQMPAPDIANGIRVAVIGAGPSGLSCAWFLQLAGCEVTVYEEKAASGGMAASVIPAFRLPAEDLAKDIERIQASGVRIVYEMPVTKDIFNSLRSEHDYVYIATGAKASKKLDIPGSQMQGVLDPLVFLADVKSGNPLAPLTNVLIIGGGNTAMDAARTAKRLTGKEGNVTILYRRSLQDMPAAKEEIDEALAEGIRIEEWVLPVAVHGEAGKITALECCRTKPGNTDQSGRSVPVVIPGSSFHLTADALIPALGQQVMAEFLTAAEMQAEPESGLTSFANVFIGGDARRGASSIIKAVADGRITAQRMLHQMDLPDKGRPEINCDQIREILVKKAIRRNPGRPAVSEFDSKSAQEEAAACLSCDIICNNCVSVCPNFANYSYTMKPVTWFLKKAIRNSGELLMLDDQIFSITQPYQILHLDDFCNECGNCHTFCPTRSAPYLEKPKLFFSARSFEKAEKGFHLQENSGMAELLYKEDAVISRLTDHGAAWQFETPDFVASLDKKDLHPRYIEWKTETATEAVFYHAAVMVTILEAARHLSLSSLKE